MPEEIAEASSSQALTRNNVEVLKACLSQQLSRRSWACALTVRKSFVQLAEYAHLHPLLFTSQVVGTTVSVAALVTVPILGAVGFSTLGPVAGSTAAAWQASIGLVKAGGLFAFCQSAAMGGAAMGTVATAGALGGVAAVAPAIREGGERILELGNLVEAGVSRSAVAVAPVVHEVGERIADVGKLVGAEVGEGVAAIAPVVQEAGGRMADIANTVKDKWCAFWNRKNATLLKENTLCRARL